MNRYAKGVRWEREVKQRLERHGWLVFRCAGSKPIDLIAVKERHLPRVFECKVGHKPPADYIKRKQDEYEKLGIIYLVAVKKKA